jgi:hypothetical protein
MAELQNRVVPQGWEKSDADTRFYEQSLLGSCDEAAATMDCLFREKCPVAGMLADILESIVADKAHVARVYGSMPFGWMHNDFREDNILRGPPQQVADWGSCFGMGPFLNDLAPFLLGSPERLAVFTARSNICRMSRPDQIREWLRAAAQARFVGLLHYLDGYYRPVLYSSITREAFLRYHLQTYRLLLERLPATSPAAHGHP